MMAGPTLQDSTHLIMYRRYVDANTYERAEMQWGTSTFQIRTHYAGAGMARLPLILSMWAKVGGNVNDGDVDNPEDGMMALDVTDSLLFVRCGGVWKKTALTIV
jgi:hypothetical protein